MNLERYELTADDNYTEFNFISEGKNGKVIKEIRFQPYVPDLFYNLAFGDKCPTSGTIDDFAVTDNGDTEKVLATITAAVFLFLKNELFKAN